MNTIEQIKTELIIQKISLKAGKAPTQIQKDMQKAIDEAWSNPEGAELRAQLFPAGKPSVEEFVMKLSKHL